MVTLQTRASEVRNGRCVDCGQFNRTGFWHFHSPPAERVRKVWSLGWDEAYVARGTDDVEVAREAVRRHVMANNDWAETKADVDQHIAGLKPDAGWWRCNPCTCGDEHRFDLGKADGPGPGNFKAVYFS